MIDRVAIKPSLFGVGMQATIMLKESISAAEIDKLIQDLAIHNLPAMKDMVDGKPAIQVRGIKDEKNLFASSDKLNPASNVTDKEKIPEDDKKNGLDLGEKIRRKSVLIPALFYDLGNIGYIISGIQRGRHNPDGKFTQGDFAEMGVGAAFSLGDVLMTVYGQDHGAEELSAASTGLRKYLKDKGIQIPEGDSLNPDTLYQSGALKSIDHWVHKNIINIRALLESVGGLNMMVSALKPGSRNNQKLAAGAFLSTGWFLTALLEKPRGHKIFNAEEPGDLSFIDRVKHNPRAYLASTSSITNNFLNFYGAMKERQKWKADPLRKHDYIYNLFSTGAFLLGNVFFGLSGRARPDETEADKALTKDLVLMAANLLTSQPELSKAAIDDAAEYISTKLAHVNLNKEEAVKVLTDKVAELSKDSWVSRMHTSSNSNTSNIMV